MKNDLKAKKAKIDKNIKEIIEELGKRLKIQNQQISYKAEIKPQTLL